MMRTANPTGAAVIRRIVETYGSHGLRATRVAAGTGQVGLTCLAVARAG